MLLTAGAMFNACILRRRTLTVLLGVLTGRWVVSASWLPPPGSACIADEAEHEVGAGLSFQATALSDCREDCGRL